jgi:hypothetical protein
VNSIGEEHYKSRNYAEELRRDVPDPHVLCAFNEIEAVLIELE